MERTVIACFTEDTAEKNLEKCVNKIRGKCENPKAIIFFSDYEKLWFYAKGLKEYFPDSISIGGSSYTLFSSEGVGKTGIVAMAINDGIECAAGQLFEIHRYPMNYKEHIRKALRKLSSTENTCCLEFTSAFSRSEELVLDTFQYVLKDKNIPVLGGSAGTTSGGTDTAVALNGDIYVDTCVFIFLHNLNGKLSYYCENLFRKTNTEFYATDIDCDERKVYEFDNKPAVFTLSQNLKVEPSQLKSKLLSEPLGRIVNDEIFITSIDEIFPDGSVSFFSRIYNHTKMAQLQLVDYQTVWTKTAQKILSDIPKPSFSIIINGISRSALFEQDNQMENFVSQLKTSYGNHIGMSGFGEQLNFNHLNQSMVIVTFE